MSKSAYFARFSEKNSYFGLFQKCRGSAPTCFIHPPPLPCSTQHWVKLIVYVQLIEWIHISSQTEGIVNLIYSRIFWKSFKIPPGLPGGISLGAWSNPIVDVRNRRWDVPETLSETTKRVLESWKVQKKLFWKKFWNFQIFFYFFDARMGAHRAVLRLSLRLQNSEEFRKNFLEKILEFPDFSFVFFLTKYFENSENGKRTFPIPILNFRFLFWDARKNILEISMWILVLELVSSVA